MKTKFSRGSVAVMLALSMACTGGRCGSRSSSSAANASEPDAQPSVEELTQPLQKARQDLAAALGVNSDPGQITPAQLAGWMTRAFDETEKAERELSRETFDPAAVARMLGRDHRRIFGWVRDNTSFVPYQGVLRGPSGVLMDRLGNSLDRALLLAELLSASGATVRLASATLADDQATELLRKAASAPRRSPEPSQPGVADGRTTLSNYAGANRLDTAKLTSAAEAVGTQSEELIRRLGQRVTTQASAVARMLDRKAMPQATPDLESVRQHWWVQSQEDAGWLDLDPTFADAEPGRPAATATATVPLLQLPADLHHELRIRVVIEQWTAGAFKEAVVLDQVLRPFEVLGQRIALRHRLLEWPGGLTLASPQVEVDLRRAVAAQSEWLPVLSVGDKNITRFSFTKSGEVNENPGTPRPRENAGVSAADALGGGSETPPDSDGRLTAEWIEYEIRTPGRKTDTIRRDVFDLVGPAARSSKRPPSPANETDDLRRALALIGQTDVLPLVCRLSSEFAQHVMNTGLLSQRPVLNAILQAGTEGNSARLAELSGQLNPEPAQLYGLAMMRHAISPVAGDVYLDRMNILSYHQRVKPDGKEGLVGSRSVDIVANEVSIRQNVEPFQARLIQGIADTTAENLFVSGCSTCTPQANVSEMWVSSQRDGTTWRPVRSLEELAQQNASLSDDVRRRIELDLAAGNAVLLPTGRSASQGRNQMGWWRIHPASGSTLGIMESGEGQAMVEWVKSKAAIVGTIITVGSFLGCIGSSGTGGAKALACLGCSASAGQGMNYFFLNVGKAWVVNMTPALAGKLFAFAVVCIIAELM